MGSPTETNYSNRRNDYAFEYSPILSQSTRDNCDVDVVWGEWNSPRSKTNIRRIKRVHATEQDKVPVKKTPSNSRLPTFGNLKEKLEAIKGQINNEKKNEKPVDDLKNVSSNDNKVEKDGVQFEDLFNDSSFEEQLVLCSQKLEKDFVLPSEHIRSTENEIKSSLVVNRQRKADEEMICVKETKIVNKNMDIDSLKAKKFNFKTNVKAQVVSLKEVFDNCCPEANNRSNIIKKSESLVDDSFESALAEFKEEDVEIKHIKDRFKERSKCLETGLKVQTKSPQFRKTNSFDDSILKPGSSKHLASLTRKTLEEIDRKRKEAMAKLEAKKRTQPPTPIDEVSPIKCSPEEIEQKRLQALAKLESKRKQEVIERNRLEALKRLEMNKKKRTVQPSLVSTASTKKSLPYQITDSNR